MSDVTANTEPTSATPSGDSSNTSGFGGLPRWLRIGIVAASTAVVVLVIAVIIRIVLQTPVIPTGSTAVEDLQPGSCLLEPGLADTYTVVTCTTPHQQQVIAKVDLTFPNVPYSADESLATYAGFTCDRLLEYRLYLPADIEKTEFAMLAIDPPTLEEWNAGSASTLCAILDDPDRPEKGGVSEDLTRDLYHPLPQS